MKTLQSHWARIAVGALLVAASAAQADYVVGGGFVLPGATSTSIWGISDGGQFVGQASNSSGNWGYIYDGGTVTRLDGPTGAREAGAIGISNNGVTVGSWWDATGTPHPYAYSGGSYILGDLMIAGASRVSVRGISPDGRYITGYYDKTTDGSAGFVYDLSAGSLVATIDPGAERLVAQGINSFGQVVGDYSIFGPTGATHSGFVYDIHTGVRNDFSFAGVWRLAPRAINDQGQIAGWLISGTPGAVSQAWIGNTSSYQIIDAGTPLPTIAEGINNLGQVVGFFASYTDTSQSPGFIASPAVLPTGPGPVPHSYSFSTAVVMDVPVFIDPLVAVGYSYKTGAGDPLFKTVSLPVGVGDNLYEIVVGDQHFFVAGHQVFDFTANGFAAGVGEFTVLGIEPQAGLDPTDGSAFVTRLTFAASGTFTGTQTALTLDYIAPNVPEPAAAWLMVAGLGGLLWRRRRRAVTGG